MQATTSRVPKQYNIIKFCVHRNISRGVGSLCLIAALLNQFLAIYRPQTGLVDWTSGLDWWNEAFLCTIIKLFVLLLIRLTVTLAKSQSNSGLKKDLLLCGIIPCPTSGT